MTKELFLEKMAEILDAEGELTLATLLKDIEEWDSLSVVSFVALANTEANRKIDVKTIRTAQTIGDLYALL